MKAVYLLITFSILFLSGSCKYIENSKRRSKIENTVNSWYGKTLSLPDSLFILKNGLKMKINMIEYFNKDIKILSFLSSDCSNCTLMQLMYWDSFYKNYRGKRGFQLILVYRGPNDYFNNVLMLEAGVQIPVLLDELDFLYNNNSLFENFNYHTILLNSDNKIIVIGNIAENKNLENLYVEEIEKYLTDEKMFRKYESNSIQK